MKRTRSSKRAVEFRDKHLRKCPVCGLLSLSWVPHRGRDGENCAVYVQDHPHKLVEGNV